MKDCRRCTQWSVRWICIFVATGSVCRLCAFKDGVGAGSNVAVRTMLGSAPSTRTEPWVCGELTSTVPMHRRPDTSGDNVTRNRPHRRVKTSNALYGTPKIAHQGDGCICHRIDRSFWQGSMLSKPVILASWTIESRNMEMHYFYQSCNGIFSLLCSSPLARRFAESVDNRLTLPWRYHTQCGFASSNCR